MYGGLELALGGLMIWWGLRAPFIWSGLTLLTVSAAGLLAARLIGMLVDGGGGAYLVSAAVYEFLALVLGGVGLWLEGRRSAIEDAPETS